MSLDEAIADIKFAHQRARRAKALETKHELAENVYPLLLKLAEAVAGDVAELGEVVDEILDSEGSVIQPELAVVLFSHIMASRSLAAAVRKLALDEVTRKKLETLCDTVEHLATQAEGGVQDAAVELEAPSEGPGAEPTEEGEDEDEGDGDRDGDDEAEDTEAAAGDEGAR